MNGFGPPAMPGMPGMGPMGIMPPGMLPPGMGGDFAFNGQGMGGGMDGPMWKRQRTEGGFTGASKEGSVFYKTRPCHRFNEGTCTFGDRCNYAHGEAELRALPPEGQQILEKLNEKKAAVPGGLQPQRSDLRPGSAGDGKGDEGPKLGAGPLGKVGVRGTAPKSRLCTRFMSTGDCSYGPNCHFAHGYEDLQPGMDMHGHGKGMPMDGQFDMPFPGPPGLMMPGGPMMPPPDFMAMAMGNMGGPPPPRPPPGPPPPGPARPSPAGQSSATPSASASGLGIAPKGALGGFDLSQAPKKPTADVPLLERVRATCALLGVGALTVKDASTTAVEAALAALHSGEAFQANVYADALEIY